MQCAGSRNAKGRISHLASHTEFRKVPKEGRSEPRRSSEWEWQSSRTDICSQALGVVEAVQLILFVRLAMPNRLGEGEAREGYSFGTTNAVNAESRRVDKHKFLKEVLPHSH